MGSKRGRGKAPRKGSKVTIDDALRMAVGHHRADRLAEARVLYEQVLKAVPTHPDALHFYGILRFRQGDAEIAERLIRQAIDAVPDFPDYHLNLGNILIDLAGDVANVETYFLAVQRREEDGKTFTRTRAGRYLDRFEKRDGVWRVANRRVIDDWSRLDEVVQAAREVGPDNTHGTRDRTDASYEVEGFMDRYKAS